MQPFASVATDLHSGHEIWSAHGRVIDAVWSFISISGLFLAIKHNDCWLIDGRLVNPILVSLCRYMGADLVIVVDVNRGTLVPPVCTDSADGADSAASV